MNNDLEVSDKINGWFYVIDTGTGMRIGVKDAKGVLKPKRFKSVVGAEFFIAKINEARVRRVFK